MSNINVKKMNELKEDGYTINSIHFEISEKVEKVNIILTKENNYKEIIVENDPDFFNFMIYHNLKPMGNGNTKFVYTSDPDSYIKNKIKFVNEYSEVNELIENQIPPNKEFLIPNNFFDLLYDFIENKHFDEEQKKINPEYAILYNEYKKIYHHFAWKYDIEFKDLKKFKQFEEKRNNLEIYFDITRLLLNETFIKPITPQTKREFPKEIFKTFKRYYKMSPIRFEFINFYKDNIYRLKKQREFSNNDQKLFAEYLIEEYSSLYELGGKLINFIRFMHEFSNGIKNPSFYLSNDKNIKYLENTEIKPLIQCLKPKIRNPRYHIEYRISNDNKNVILYDSRPGIKKEIDKIPINEIISLNNQIHMLIIGIMLSITFFEIKLILALITSPQYILKLQELEPSTINKKKDIDNYLNRAEDCKMGDGILPPQARNGQGG